MGFADLQNEPHAALLQRSLERGRLGHAYLLEGEIPETLETVARTLAKTLNCSNPNQRSASGDALDCCDACTPCRNTDSDRHPDIHWLRPESKSRIIRAEKVRDLLDVMHLKPNEDGYKVGILAGADRLNTQAANIFLKTLEEPPQRSVFLLLTTEPQRLLETILSRCLRLRFDLGTVRQPSEDDRTWLEEFSQLAASEAQGLFGHYRLLGLLLSRLAERKERVEHDIEARSPLQEHTDIDKSLKDKWEAELAAAIEAEYRHQRAETLKLIQRWMRDIWLCSLGLADARLTFPDLAATREMAARVTAVQALANLEVLEQLQRLLHTNVQEALALEVSLLKLHL